MQQYIISMESVLGSLNIHIIQIGVLEKPKTLLVPIIHSPKKIKEIRYLLENLQLGELAMWFKQEYNLPHSKISLAFGPEIRHWLNDNKNNFYNNKEEFKNESKNL